MIPEQKIQFNFSSTPKEGYVSMIPGENDTIPRYDHVRGFGFVDQTCAMPPRQVHLDSIVAAQEGYLIREAEFREDDGEPVEHHNRYGLCFRVKVPPGAYNVQVRTTSDQADMVIAISGMNTQALLQTEFWDAAKLITNQTRIQIDDRQWSYNYVNGREYIDIEIEPKRLNCIVGISEIVITRIPQKDRPEHQLPTVFTLGDSTVKSYIFEEAPMSGWGQVFDNLFDPLQVRVINYSMGGRSFKSAYTEGRFNDILMTGCAQDYVLIQFGHNDESMDENRRFGRGSTESMYRTYLQEIYIPAIRARGMIPILVTPMSRVDAAAKSRHIYTNSFNNRKFPQVMREMAAKLGVTLIDLNKESLRYYNEIGVEATTAIFMSIEAGETPGKTNDGSFANGHPIQRNDGTHFKESLSKQFARMVATCLAKEAEQGNQAVKNVASWLKNEVKTAIQTNNWSTVFPEIAVDTLTGSGAYYRNQIEKLVQLGVFSLDDGARFNPEEFVNIREFSLALSRLLEIDSAILSDCSNNELTRETMGKLLHDAYQAKFDVPPPYMTEYNGDAITPDHPAYDPHLAPDQRGTMYYPLISYEQLEDTAEITPELLSKVKKAYQWGLFRSEKGIERGKQCNGNVLEPKKRVTREKAAKVLYYMWVLAHPINMENDISCLKTLKS